MEKIKFQVELNRVIEVLSKEIYDSPYALLRENVQNAYDAILMRERYTNREWSAKADGLIKVQVDKEEIAIIDNGIGMSEKVLKENYWKAGSSGKNTKLAKESGVIGTFGIGGMANFGVCSKLRIETESIETKERIISEVDRNNLSLSEDCISVEKSAQTGVCGTKVIVTLDPQVIFDLEFARSYLSQYVQYMPTKVEMNGVIVSQKSMEERWSVDSPRLERNWVGFEHAGLKADISVKCDYNAMVSAAISNISLSGEAIDGEAYLRQDGGHLWGFRSSFGLAPMAMSSFYSLGGIVNSSILSPTAGREALSQASTDFTAKLVQLVEECATLALSESELSNRSNPFMSHILSTGRISLAGKLQIKVEPEQEMTLDSLKEYSQSRSVRYYDGTDEATIKSLATPDELLIIQSRSNPRRQVETQFIQRFCKAEKITDKPQILTIHPESEYDMDELSLALLVKNILEDDYALQNTDVKFADLTHNLSLLVSLSAEGTVEIAIQRRHPSIQPILKCYHDSRDVFPGFIKDYVRVYIYPQIRSWVPSSTREGADALQKILKKKRELYKYGIDDIGLTSAFSEFLAGKMPFNEVIDKFNAAKNIQKQEIARNNIGRLEALIPDLIDTPVQPQRETPPLAFQPSPAILRTEVITDKKLLLVDKESPVLNNFKMFLAISERAFREEYYFFVTPHSTRIIWGGHRIIFIFTHPSSQFSLYYYIELFEDVGGLAGGGIFSTTTIVTKDKIFIPIPNNLMKYFEIASGRNEKKFYVRFDML